MWFWAQKKKFQLRAHWITSASVCFEILQTFPHITAHEIGGTLCLMQKSRKSKAVLQLEWYILMHSVQCSMFKTFWRYECSCRKYCWDLISASVTAYNFEISTMEWIKGDVEILFASGHPRKIVSSFQWMHVKCHLGIYGRWQSGIGKMHGNH